LTSQLNSIFQGIPPISGRIVFGQLMKDHKFSRYVMPCCGRFVGPQLLVGAGVDPKKIYASDISIFSSVLGYYLTDKPIEKLGIKFHDIPFSLAKGSQLEKAVECMLAIKYVQIPPTHFYNQEVKRELVVNHSQYFAEIKNQLEGHYAKLHGIHYEIKDVRHVFEEEYDKENTMLYINPPAFKNGYKKMFEWDDKITWKRPKVEQFNPEFYGEAMQQLRRMPVTVISNEIFDEGIEGYTKIFSEEFSEGSQRIISNKKFKERFFDKRIKDTKRPKYQLYDDHEITKNSKIVVKLVDSDIAYHYRDLFIHRLGASSAQLTVAIFIDGQLLSTAGFDPTMLCRTGDNYIHETYGMTIPSEKYPKLGRLFMYFLTCKQFRDDLVRLYPQLSITDFTHFKTACLTRLPEMRSNHGLMKITKKDKTKNGFYKLVYETDFHDRDYRKCIILWLDELRRK